VRDPWDGSHVDVRRALPAIIGVLAGLVLLGALRPDVLGTIAVIVAILVMIMLHELGHFVMAKRAGMAVREFFVGFGPRLWSVQRGETEYGIKALPLGGYVRIVGMNNLEEVDPADEQRTYRSKPFHQRFAVAIAGSTMHFLIALVLIFMMLGPVGAPAAKPIVHVATATDDSGQPLPAATAGFQSGDRIVAIDGHRVRHWPDVPDRVQAAKKGATLVFTVERDGQRVDIPVVPRKTRVGGTEGVFIGVEPVRFTEHEPVLRAAGDSFVAVGKGIGTAAGALGHFFSPAGIRTYVDNVEGRSNDDNRLLSPIGAGRVANEAVKNGIADVLLFLFAINLFVGVFNLVPLMPLDGGLVAIALYEKIASTVRRRRVQVDVSKLLPITAAVLLALVVLGVSALYLDVVHPISKPF